jgi:hypothetical protein
MNQDHHRQYAVDALRTTVALSGSGVVPQGAGPALLRGLGDKSIQGEFVEAAAAPDRIRDIRLTLPLLPGALNLFPDAYCVLGHNLSSFQHFQCSRNGVDAGYLWNEDISLTLPGEWATSEVLEHLHTCVVYQQGSGELPPFFDTLATPMKVFYMAQHGKTLDDFVFPSAAQVGVCYGDRAFRAWGEGDFEGWRRCAGFALHFVHDALVPHHVWGNLLHGHSEWEDQISSFWKNHMRHIQSADPTGQLYKDTVCKAVAGELDDILKLETNKSVMGLIHANADYTTEWLKYRGVTSPTDLKVCESADALRICIRAIASSVRALMLMMS